jgi:hypothetical protein
MPENMDYSTIEQIVGEMAERSGRADDHVLRVEHDTNAHEFIASLTYLTPEQIKNLRNHYISVRGHTIREKTTTEETIRILSLSG